MVPLLHAPAGRAPGQCRFRDSRHSRRAMSLSSRGLPPSTVCSYDAYPGSAGGTSPVTQPRPCVFADNSVPKPLTQLRLSSITIPPWHADLISLRCRGRNRATESRRPTVKVERVIVHMVTNYPQRLTATTTGIDAQATASVIDARDRAFRAVCCAACAGTTRSCTSRASA